jgi:hypothetical protein
MSYRVNSSSPSFTCDLEQMERALALVGQSASVTDQASWNSLVDDAFEGLSQGAKDLLGAIFKGAVAVE